MSDSKYDGWIDVTDPDSLNRWSHELHIDERTLKVAVAMAGTSISDVLSYLNGPPCGATFER
jgi:hypothetical protein